LSSNKKSFTVHLDTICSHIQSSSNEIDLTNSELIPERCNENIARSKEEPLWAWIEESGGYTLHPVHAPASTNNEVFYKIREGGNSQNEILFNLANDISLAPIIKGSK